MDNNTNINPANQAPVSTGAAPAEQKPRIPELDPRMLSAEGQLAFAAAYAKAANEAKAACEKAIAQAKSDEPWYWSRFSKGLYLGVALTALAWGGYEYFTRNNGGEE